MMSDRDELVSIALNWEKKYGVMPAITSTISEYDAVRLIGVDEKEISSILNMPNKTAVTKGFDFKYNGIRYQVKANRPSGKKGSTVSKVANASNLEWDFLIWILYNTTSEIEEAWIWDVNQYAIRFPDKKQRIHPNDIREGGKLY